MFPMTIIIDDSKWLADFMNSPTLMVSAPQAHIPDWKRTIPVRGCETPPTSDRRKALRAKRKKR